MDRLVTALDRCHRRQGEEEEQQQQQQHEDNGTRQVGMPVEIRCIRPFDADCVAFLDGFLYGNTNTISSLHFALCELSPPPPCAVRDDDDHDPGNYSYYYYRERDVDRRVLPVMVQSSLATTTSNTTSTTTTTTTTTALDAICRFLACPRTSRHTTTGTTALKSLTFMACHLTNENARRIVQALRFSSTCNSSGSSSSSHRNTHHHHQPDHAAAAAAATTTDHHQHPIVPITTTIAQLDLSRNELHGVDGGVIVGEFLILVASQLTHLNLSHNPGLGSDAMMPGNMRRGLSQCTRLVKLNLHGCMIGNTGLAQLCLALPLLPEAPMEELDVGDNDLQGGTAGVGLAFMIQHMIRLKTLIVAGNPQLGPDGILALGKALVHCSTTCPPSGRRRHHEFLTTLSVSDCGMGNVGVEYLDQVLQESLLGKNTYHNNHHHHHSSSTVGIYKSLTHLHLARNNISNGAALGSLLSPFTRLQRCTLSGNPLGPSGVADLGPVVVAAQLGRSLQHLQMTNCRLGNAGIDYTITQIYAKSPSLQTIQLGSNHDAALPHMHMVSMECGHEHHHQQQHLALYYNNNIPDRAPPLIPRSEKCGMCHDCYRENAELKKLPCGRHYVHSSCLYSWRRNNDAVAIGRNAQVHECPFCRQEATADQSSTTTTALVPSPNTNTKVDASKLGPAKLTAAVTGQNVMTEDEDDEEEEAMAGAMEEGDASSAVAPPTAALQRQDEWPLANGGGGEVVYKGLFAAAATRNNGTAQGAAPDADDNDDDTDDDASTTRATAYKGGMGQDEYSEMN
jgi:hypothetical protein